MAQGQGRGFGPGEHHWDYVEVREGAHMFYWLYYTTANVTYYTERPLVIWLQGGPGGPSTGFGNFYELGPLDIHGNLREGNFVQHVNVLFIDSPVGAGFSYVDNTSLLVTNNNELTNDLVSFMEKFYKNHKKFKTVPLHIFSESYGGIMVPEFARKLDLALKNGAMANPSLLKSISIGNPWISPMHSIREHSRYLYENGLIDEDGVALLDTQLKKIKQFDTDTELKWFDLIDNLTSNASLYNTHFSVDNKDKNTYGYTKNLVKFMSRNISEALKINGGVFGSQVTDLLNTFDFQITRYRNTIPRILNDTSIKVNIFSGELDIMCNTKGTLALINDWQWRNKKEYLQATRKPININGRLQGYEKIGGDFAMYWINHAGHIVARDSPTAMQYILKAVTHYNDLVSNGKIN
ncbi:retinoid-inducible serine carboxypeptidase-like [Drosophila tropicalis]|uniref:retinoid-inducible serine carboxypeptidase-like n=1 Tax=Drosophila tropicalis TaxID=46794 RepID=UPI0035ABFE26